jgi:serine protease inhibitor
MTVNRPFIFFVHDRQTVAILFVGRVLDPTR